MARTALKIPPGLVSDDTVHAAKGRWGDGSNVRFVEQLPQVIGGWEAITASLLTGVCRTAFNWSDNDGQLNIAFGTHLALQVWVGGGLYTITPSGLAAGEIDGTGQAGYGTGPYGAGGYATPSTDDYFPRTWSLAAWGENLLASPRNDTIYQRQNNTGSLATALSNAPDNVTYMLVAPQDQVFALGCNEESGGVFNALCIRHSSVRNNNEWITTGGTTAREYILPGGGRIVAGRVMGAYLLVWTNHGLFLGTYVGQLGQVWRFDKVGDKCGLIGPNAAVVVGQSAFWIGPDRQFYAYSLGGSVNPLVCPISDAFKDNLAFAQSDKIVASSNSGFSEIRWDYPDDRDGYENSRYLAVTIAGANPGAWHRGIMARTAFVDAGPSPYPIGVESTVDGDDSTGAIFWHERGESADGAAFAWHIETADQFLSEDRAMLVRGLWPDIQNQIGAAYFTLTSRFKPRGDEVVKGPYTISTTADKVDIRASGRLFRMKFSGSSAPTAFRLGLPVLDIVPTGMR